VVVELIVGSTIVTSVPPVDAVYQWIVPALAVAENTTCPDPQTEDGVTDADVTVGTTFTVAVTAVREAEIHPCGLTASA
jgi:hypothetical protein